MPAHPGVQPRQVERQRAEIQVPPEQGIRSIRTVGASRITNIMVHMAIVSYTSSIPQNDFGNYIGPFSKQKITFQGSLCARGVSLDSSKEFSRAFLVQTSTTRAQQEQGYLSLFYCRKRAEKERFQDHCLW